VYDVLPALPSWSHMVKTPSAKSNLALGPRRTNRTESLPARTSKLVTTQPSPSCLVMLKFWLSLWTCYSS
jgi:hypothetical protein